MEMKDKTKLAIEIAERLKTAEELSYDQAEVIQIALILLYGSKYRLVAD